MFDVKRILSRSWHILWSYRVLWIFGFMLALGVGGGNSGGNSNYSPGDRDRAMAEWRTDWQSLHGKDAAQILQEVFRWVGQEVQKFQAEYPVEFSMIVAAILAALVVILLFSLLTTFLRYVAETASIRMVDEYEQTGKKVGFRQGWRYGWSRAAWRLFLTDLLVNIPLLILFVILGLMIWWIVTSALSGVESSLITSLIAGIGLAFLSTFIVIVLLVILYVLRDFAWRMIALEGMGVMDSLRNALGLVRRQWKNVGLMWLVMLGLRILWTIVFFILILPLLIVSILTAVGGLLVAIIPSLLTAGIASLLSAPNYWPWVFAAIVGLPLFAVVAFSPILLVQGWGLIYQSSVWTLTYRELKTIEAMSISEQETPESQIGG